MRIASIAVKQSELPARLVDSGESPDKMRRQMISIKDLYNYSVETGDFRHEQGSR
jgi:hypothetical protein